MINLHNIEKQNKTLKDVVDPYLPRKKDILPYLEFIIGSVESKDPSLFNLAMGLPVAGKGLKLFRGVPKWFKKEMTKAGKYVGKQRINPKTKKTLFEGIYVSPDKNYAKEYMRSDLFGGSSALSYTDYDVVGKPSLLEFEVPFDYIKKHAKKYRNVKSKKGEYWMPGEKWNLSKEEIDILRDVLPDNKLSMDLQLSEILFKKGIPKEFLKKVHQYEKRKSKNPKLKGWGSEIVPKSWSPRK